MEKDADAHGPPLNLEINKSEIIASLTSSYWSLCITTGLEPKRKAMESRKEGAEMKYLYSDQQLL